VREQLLRTLEDFTNTPVEKERLDAVKQYLRYRFSLSLNNTDSIAATVARSLRGDRSVHTIDRLYDLYERISPEDIQRAAKKYLGDNNRTIVTLTGGRR
jgi:zinc protease